VKIEKWIEKNEASVDAHGLFKEWVEMKCTHNPWREEQAFIIIRMLESIEAERLTVVDLGCRAGGLSEYLLKSLRNVRIIGMDSNPFLLMICRNHLAEYRERFSLILGDFRNAETIRRAGDFQAAVSLTTFHNLSRQSILDIYRLLYQSLPKGGLFVNGDVVTLSDEWFETMNYSSKPGKPVISTKDYWQKIKSRYGIAEEIDEMLESTSFRDIPEHGYQSSFYLNSLRWAGFKTAEVVFQAGNRIVYCGRKN
jgi:cyclopropane fatty-acyl-phospholipid synthase-like methyltransferase